MGMKTLSFELTRQMIASWIAKLLYSYMPTIAHQPLKRPCFLATKRPRSKLTPCPTFPGPSPNKSYTPSLFPGWGCQIPLTCFSHQNGLLLPSHAFVENLALRFAHQKNGHIGHVDGKNIWNFLRICFMIFLVYGGTSVKPIINDNHL